MILKTLKIYSTILVLLATFGAHGKSGPETQKCSIASIHSLKKINQAIFTQTGVGWIYQRLDPSSPNKYESLRLVTPAHVTFDGTQIFAFCNGTPYELLLIGFSQTLDLAALEFRDMNAAKKIFKPLFKVSEKLTLSELDTEIFNTKGLLFPNVAFFNENKLSFNVLGPTSSDNNNDKETFNYNFPQYKKVLLNSTGGIRPGMSGSPFFTNKDYPAGMSIKTKINDHVTFILPTKELVTYLPELEKGQDPWKKEHPYYEIQFVHSFDQNKNTLKRFRRFIKKDSNGKIIESFREPCDFGTMSEASNWTPVGGSWADSGNPEQKDKSSFIYTGDFNKLKKSTIDSNSDSGFLFLLATPQYFLSKQTCSQEGLINEKTGQRLLGLVIPNSQSIPIVTKTENLENLIFAKRMQEKTKNSNSLFTTDAIYQEDSRANLSLICNKSFFPEEQLVAHGDKVDTSEAETFIPSRPWNETDVDHFLHHKETINNKSLHMLLVKEKKYLTTLVDNPGVFIECSKDRKQIDIVTTVHDWAYHFRLSQGRFEGTFSISNIDDIAYINGFHNWFNKYQFDIKTKNLWNYLVDDKEKGFKILITLDPFNDPLVSIRFLEIPAEEKTKHSFGGYNNEIPPLEYMESLWYKGSPPQE